MGSRRGALEGLHILVVEDDEDAREILRTVLEYFGALETVTATAHEGVENLRRVAPDLVIADVQPGDQNATRLVREARRRSSRTLFLAISAADFDARHLRQQGFATYLRKPIDHDTLVDTILSLVNRT